MMALRFEHSFVVNAPAERVWAHLTDPYRVAPALPGAAITEKGEDGSYGGTITVKVGPVSAKYRGSLRFETLDAGARTAAMVATGKDLSGRGGADMKMQSRLVEKGPSETEVSVVSEVNVTGILAQFGRGLIQDVSNQMFQRFTAAVKAELEKDGGSTSTSTSTSTITSTSTLAITTTSPSPSTSTSTSTSTSPSPSTSTSTGTSTDTDTGSGTPPASRPPDPPPPVSSPPIEVVSFGTKILARAAGRTMRRPVFWVVVVAAAGLVTWLLSH